MNLIPCAKGCLHQSEGYCTKDAVSQPSAAPKEGCPYYESAPKIPANPPSTPVGL